MKRTAILLALVAALSFAPSAFACWKCNLTVGCYGTEIGEPGRLNCDFDGACHVSGFCQGFTGGDTPPLAASYTVAAVLVVDTTTEQAPDLTTNALWVPLPEPQVAAKAVVER